MWASSLVALGWCIAGATAQEITWYPAGTRPAVVASSVPAAPALAATSDSRSTPAVTLGTPIVSLGTPVALNQAPTATPAVTDPQVVAVSFQASELGTAQPLIRMQAPDVPPPVPGPPPVVVPGGPPPPGALAGPPGLPADPYNCGVANPPAPGFWSNTWQWIGQTCGPVEAGGRKLFQSDHCFDEFISPVSNPFLFEDPRSLTEIRPIFMLQGTPDSARFFHGGDVEFFGIQARVAVTERVDFVMNKLGWVWTDIRAPEKGEPFASNGGFGELWLGPKFTFLRNDQTQTLGAAGVTFQIPAGSPSVFQNTGDVSIVPYMSFGQNFLRSSYGSFNALGTTGYAFGDHERTQYFFLSGHLDYDVANLHKIYPLIEINWMANTVAGQNMGPFGFEGGDLFNFGDRGQSGKENLTMALGGRYKFTEWAQVGSTIEFPLVKSSNLMDFRWTIDFIFRY